MHRSTVLIGFADSLSAPEVAWDLKEAGHEVVAFAKIGTRPALASSSLVRIAYVTDPAQSVTRTLSDLEALHQRLGRPIWMPLDDLSIWLVDALQARCAEPIPVAGASGALAQLALDKHLQCQAATAAGLAVPDTRLLQSIGDLRSVTTFPVVVKPRLAARVVRDRLDRGRSYTLAGSAELESCAHDWNGAEPMLLQPFMTGTGEGLFGLALGDGAVCWSAHRRLRMMNPAGSGASACISGEPDPALLAPVERLLASVRWRGLFMIEFLVDEQGRRWFIELNGRPWGSIALARRLGFHYPSWTVRLLAQPDYRPSATPITAGRVCRHVGRELIHLAFVWRGPQSKAFRNWPTRARALGDVLRWNRDDHWYNYNRFDRRVFWADIYQTLRSQLRRPHRRTRRSVATRVAHRVKRPFIRRQQAAVRARGDVRNLLDSTTKILFVCYGNINRSALAEQHLKLLLGSEAHVTSCGFHEPDGRPLDFVMRRLAAEAGVIFGPWSSRIISRDMVDAADIIFAMESAHLVRLLDEYPQARGRSFLLSCVMAPEAMPLDIEDPHRQKRDAYRRCIRNVTLATATIHRLIEKSAERVVPRAMSDPIISQKMTEES